MQKLDTTNIKTRDGEIYLMPVLYIIGIFNDALSL
jgi:hypothetical protein